MHPLTQLAYFIYNNFWVITAVCLLVFRGDRFLKALAILLVGYLAAFNGPSWIIFIVCVIAVVWEVVYQYFKYFEEDKDMIPGIYRGTGRK